MNKYFALFFCFQLLIVNNLKCLSQTILDDFTDGNYTASPIWSTNGGLTPTVSLGKLNVRAEAGRLSTPFTTDCMEWGYTIKSNTTSNCGDFRYFFLLKDNADPGSTASSGYFIEYDGSLDRYAFYRKDGGTITQIGASYSGGSPNTTTHSIIITRDASFNYSVSIDGTVRISLSDNTYPPSTCQYQAIRALTCAACTCTDTYSIDDIYYVPSCLNPASAGLISGNQTSICGSYDPTPISSTSAASGHTGTLEYKWQSSTTSSLAGFSDIASSNSTTYDPSTITQTTWYKRIARVTCKSNWIGASESNVIEKRVDASISFDGVPLNDTIYNQLGNASFGVGVNNPADATYQWQVSTNGGGSWSNISNGGFYLGVTTTTLQVTNPAYSMDGYLYRCSVTNACGTVNSSSATLRVIQIAVFSNTTSTSCGTNLNNDYSFQRNIVVSGLPTTLGTASGQFVLKQVNLQLGTSTCKGVMSSYKARLKSPNGTIIQLFNQFTDNNSANIWANIKYRDHVALERIRQYADGDEGSYHPFSIGYYAIETDGSFFSVNGENPNGTWIFELAENVVTGNEVSFQKVELVFGPKFNYTDISSSTENDNCANPQCISTQEIVIGTNTGYSSFEPASSWLGTTADGCGWNGANNNSAWFRFFASATSAYITISGIVNPTAGGNDTQPIIFSRTGDCSNMGPIDVPTGGCLDDVGDATSVNLMDYMSPNGGISSINNLYADGISMNAEFRLSGLTIGKTYYLYIDGNGGTPSSFYIEALNGCQTCYTLLPVELIDFNATSFCNNIELSWTTVSERNNETFVVEESEDGYNFDFLTSVKGQGNSTTEKFYSTKIDRVKFKPNTYIRLSQIDFDGNKQILKINYINNDCNQKNVFFNQNKLFVSGYDTQSVVMVFDMLGKLIVQDNIINLDKWILDTKATYIVQIQNQGQTFIHKVFNY